MSKNGLRMVVSQNFDMTHLSAPSNLIVLILRNDSPKLFFLLLSLYIPIRYFLIRTVTLPPPVIVFNT